MEWCCKANQWAAQASRLLHPPLLPFPLPSASSSFFFGVVAVVVGSCFSFRMLAVAFQKPCLLVQTSQPVAWAGRRGVLFALLLVCECASVRVCVWRAVVSVVLAYFVFSISVVHRNPTSIALSFRALLLFC